MILTAQTPEAELYAILDCKGNRIPYVTYFDSETCEIEMALRAIPKEGSDVVFLSELSSEGVPSECLIRFKLVGARLELIPEKAATENSNVSS